jgi:hypothetical protein
MIESIFELAKDDSRKKLGHQGNSANRYLNLIKMVPLNQH